MYEDFSKSPEGNAVEMLAYLQEGTRTWSTKTQTGIFGREGNEDLFFWQNQLTFIIRGRRVVSRGESL